MAPKRRRQDKAQSKGDVVTQKRIKLQHRDNTTATAKITSTSAQDSTSNTTQPAQSAAAQAFATTELLEQILLAVDDIKSLLLMRRVAPQWRTFIDETSSLKNKMWLVPQQLDHEEHEWYLSPGAIYLHKRPRTTDAAAVAGSGDVIYRFGEINTFLFHIEPRGTKGHLPADLEIGVPFHLDFATSFHPQASKAQLAQNSQHLP
ncbi:hypothetical protein MBLNU13_g07143t2 [Cladosporium sp. NU13]